MIEPMHEHELREEERANSLQYLMFLKQKQTGLSKIVDVLMAGNSPYT